MVLEKIRAGVNNAASIEVSTSTDISACIVGPTQPGNPNKGL